MLCRVCSVASSGADGQPVPIGQCPSPRATAVLTLWPRAARTHTRVLPRVAKCGARAAYIETIVVYVFMYAVGVSSRPLVPRRAAGSFSDFGATGHSTTTLSLSLSHHSPQERARQRRLRVRCALRCKPAAFRSATSFMLSSCPDCPRSSELINSACVRKSDTTWEICPTLSSSAAADC